MKFISLALAVALSFCATTAPGFANSHEDKRLGFKIYTPKKWASIPISSDEGWIVAKYLSPKPYFFTDKSLGWTYEHKPELAVVAFLSEKYKEDSVVEEKDADGNLKKITFKFTNPYKNYADYLKGTYSGAGFFIAEEVEETVGDYLVTQYLIKVEKGSNGPKRIMTWVYHTPDIDFAVQMECFESAYPKLKNDIQKTLRSFEEIPRTEGTVSKTGVTGGEITFSSKEMTVEERAKDRKSKETVSRETAVESLTEGWEFEEIDPFLILNHTNDKQAKIWAERGTAIFNWCEDRFPYLGKDEYVSKLVLRICEDMDEAIAFSPFRWTSRRPLEVVVYKDDVGVGSWQHMEVNEVLLGHWMRHKNPSLYFDMPNWMKFGLEYIVRYSKPKGKKLELRASDWENMGLREEVKAGTARTPREIFLADAGVLSEENFPYEAAALMRFLLVGAGSKNRLTKGILEDYFTNLQLVIAAIDEEEDGGEKQKEATTEEEEEARFKARQARAKENADRVRDETFAATFGSWSDKDWLQFEKLYFKAIK